MNHVPAALLAACALALPAPAAPVLVEAEGFARTGGWVVDPQFMDQMGSPYLLAHGLGVPVADAETEVALPAGGRYRVWVRTKDWVAPWKAPGAPGRFQVLLDGRPLPTLFGTTGAEWHWQDGGVIELTGPRVRLTLHDLTGFEGRCDAILLTADEHFTPPNRDPEMAAFRRACLGLPEDSAPAGEFDFVVCGGGIAGTCAALAAARLGLTVALVQDRPVLGGNNSSEVRVWLQGARNKEPWPRVGDIVAELEQKKSAHYGPANTAELYEDERKLALARAEPNLRLFLEHRANGVEKDGARIRAVLAQEIRTGRRVRLAGRWFADCTGDAAVGVLAGADHEMQPKGRMGPCNLWNVCECKDTNALNTAVRAEAGPQPFPRCPWALDLSDKPFPGRSKTKPNTSELGGWYWESGFDRDPIADMEYIRDWNFRAMYGAWDAMKNVDGVLPNHRLNWAAFILGKRESRQLLGDVVLCFDDLKNDRSFPDGCVPTGWSNDLHVPDPKYAQGFEGEAFISKAIFEEFPAHRQKRPFWIPYRCLYSRNVENLFMAGRNLSTKHEALGAVRVMRTCGGMGEIVGMAASLCRKHDAAPRDIYTKHLDELKDLMRRGVGRGDGWLGVPPAWLAQAGPNLARLAVVSAPGGTRAGSVVTRVNDGLPPSVDNAARWLGAGPLSQVLEFAWPAAVTVGALRVVSGYSGLTMTAPIRDFALQRRDGDAWHDIPGAAAAGNDAIAWSARFAPVVADRLRLCVTATEGDIARIWEVELYGLAPALPP